MCEGTVKGTWVDLFFLDESESCAETLSASII